jgi:hypothetical protein
MNAHTRGILDFALAQFELDAAVRLADAYKWLFQASQGSEHAITDESGPRAWLEQEWANLTPAQKNEPLMEALRPDGALVRFHLRPYQARNGDKEALFGAFVASASAFRAPRADFIALWHELGHRLQQQPLAALSYAEWEIRDEIARGVGYPAIHHSPDYRQARRPAYRVLTGAAALALQATIV